MSDDFGNTASVKERCIAPRHKVNLRASVLITAIAWDITGERAEERYLALQGQLLDVSRSGLALIISSADYRELEALGKEAVLQLMLPLPAQAVELEASPVRFERLNQGERVLLGAHITKMRGRDRILFMEFINQYESAG